MIQSATAGRVAERKLATATRLTTVSRRLTADRGLTGFTIEEVCDEVGVSRRTFFNYFPSKEDAVFGIDEGDELEHLATQFLSRGSRGWSAVIDDLLEIIVEFVSSAGLNAADHLQFMAILEREPRLLARFIGAGRERDVALAELIALREGVAPSDPLAQATVQVISTVMRSTGERLSEPGVAEDFGAALTQTLAAIRAVLASPSAGKAHA